MVEKGPNLIDLLSDKDAGDARPSVSERIQDRIDAGEHVHASHRDNPLGRSRLRQSSSPESIVHSTEAEQAKLDHGASDAEYAPEDHDMPEGARPIPNFDDPSNRDHDLSTRTDRAQYQDPYADGRR